MSSTSQQHLAVMNGERLALLRRVFLEYDRQASQLLGKAEVREALVRLGYKNVTREQLDQLWPQKAAHLDFESFLQLVAKLSLNEGKQVKVSSQTLNRDIVAYSVWRGGLFSNNIGATTSLPMGAGVKPSFYNSRNKMNEDAEDADIAGSSSSKPLGNKVRQMLSNSKSNENLHKSDSRTHLPKSQSIQQNLEMSASNSLAQVGNSDESLDDSYSFFDDYEEDWVCEPRGPGLLQKRLSRRSSHAMGITTAPLKGTMSRRSTVLQQQQVSRPSILPPNVAKSTKPASMNDLAKQTPPTKEMEPQVRAEASIDPDIIDATDYNPSVAVKMKPKSEKFSDSQFEDEYDRRMKAQGNNPNSDIAEDAGFMNLEDLPDSKPKKKMARKKTTKRNENNQTESLPIPNALFNPSVRKQLQKKKEHWPIFNVLNLLICVFFVGFSLYLNNGVESLSVNPFLGPKSSILVQLGGKYVACMKYIDNPTMNTPYYCVGQVPGYNGPTSLFYGGQYDCSYGDFLDWMCTPYLGAFAKPDTPDQWWRLFPAMFLHVGIIHLGLNGMMLYNFGFALERVMGTLRFVVFYVVCGFGGNLFSALMAPKSVTVGASTAIYGLFALLYFDLYQNWPLLRTPCKDLLSLTANVIVSFGIGLLPYVDNYAHVGGFVTGVLLATVFMPHIYYNKWDRLWKRTLAVISLPMLAFLFGYGLYSFLDSEESPQELCSWCKYLDCIPPDSEWCLPERQT